jgi:hypothetical protein
MSRRSQSFIAIKLSERLRLASLGSPPTVARQIRGVKGRDGAELVKAELALADSLWEDWGLGFEASRAGKREDSWVLPFVLGAGLSMRGLVPAVATAYLGTVRCAFERTVQS